MAIELDIGNLFDIISKSPVRIRYKNSNDDLSDAVPLYTMGGLGLDYNLMTNIPGLFALGEANFSDHWGK